MPGYVVRNDVVWPAGLELPGRPPAVVYLDLNHYINLAKVSVGTAPDGYAELLEASRRARADGRAIFPLSSTHCVEISNIRSSRQRGDIVRVMEELSDFSYLLGRPQIMRLEIESALDELTRTAASGGVHIPLIGPSALWAFGKRGGLIVEGEEGEEAEARLRDRLGTERFGQMMDHFNREAERMLLTGPDDEDAQELRKDGYAPERTYQLQEARGERERQQAAILDANPEWRRDGLRDLMSACEVFHEVNDALSEAIAARGITQDELLTMLGGEDKMVARSFTDGMPSSRVAISVKGIYHRDGRHEWTSNDLHDIDAVAIAVPYCDAVFPDKAAWNALTSSPELRIFDTFLARRPRELARWLDETPGAQSQRDQASHD